MNQGDLEYIRTAMLLALGAIKMLAREGDRSGEIVRPLEVAVEKVEHYATLTTPAK